MQNVMTFDELKLALETSTGYFIGITLFNDNRLNHLYLTKDFPQNDMLRSLATIKGLVISELEKPFTPTKTIEDADVTNS